MPTKNDPDAAVLKDLQKIPNIGPKMARDLVDLGIRHIKDLREKDALDMYDELCQKTGQKQDPCVLDVFRAAVDYSKTGVAKPWWDFTPLRKG